MSVILDINFSSFQGLFRLGLCTLLRCLVTVYFTDLVPGKRQLALKLHTVDYIQSGICIFVRYDLQVEVVDFPSYISFELQLRLVRMGTIRSHSSTDLTSHWPSMNHSLLIK